jgi:predicted peroxiredoxin
MNDSVLVTLSCGTDNTNRATRALFFAMVAKKKGKQAATGDSADDHLTFLQEYEVPLLVCTPCAVTRQITEADLVKGARMAKGDEMIDLACSSTVLSF